MDRGSSKHAQRLDDQMERETLGLTEGSGGGRVEEWRDVEPSGEDEPNVSLEPELSDAAAGPVPVGLSADERERRARLGRFLRRSVFPATKDALLAEAAANHAPDSVTNDLAQLPPNGRHANVAEVYAAIVGEPESELDERF